MGFGHRCENDDDQVNVGGDRLELAPAVRAAQFCIAGQLRNDHADALIARAPDDSVAGHQCWQVGAQVAAENLTLQLAFLRFDFYLHAKMRDDQPRLFGTEIAAFQRFESG